MALFKQLYALAMRGPMFRVMVRDEMATTIAVYGDRAHAHVVEKLRRTDLTSRYRVMLRAVERQLRTQARGRAAPSHFVGT